MHHPVDMGLVGENGWNPTGEERRKEAFTHMATINNAMPPEHRAETAKSSAPTALFQKKFMTSFFDASDMPYLMKMMQDEGWEDFVKYALSHCMEYKPKAKG